MENTFSRVEELVDSVKEYLNNRIDQVKLAAAEKASEVMSNILAAVVVAVVFFFFFIFSSMALAYGLGAWIGKTWAGFAIVAGIHLLTGLVVWSARGRLIRLPIMNALLGQLFTQTDDHEEDQQPA